MQFYYEYLCSLSETISPPILVQAIGNSTSRRENSFLNVLIFLLFWILWVCQVSTKIS